MRASNSLPLVSIITPTYNHERYIAECIESVLAQTYQSWEMLVIDDGSADHTWEIVQDYVAKDPRVRAFRQENKGIFRLAETYNFALEKSRGTLVAILEGDDYWPAEKLHLQTGWHLQNPEVLLSYGEYINVHPDKSLPGEKPARQGCISGLEWFKIQALRQSGIIAAAVVMRRDALVQIGGFVSWEGFPAVDSPTYFALARRPRAVFYLGSEITAYWRHHDHQVTAGKGVLLAEMNTAKVLEVFSSLTPEMRGMLGVTEAEILKARWAGLADAYLGATRSALMARDREEALSLALCLWKYGGPKRKIQALAARLAAHLGLDIEPLFSGYEALAIGSR